MSKDDTLWDLFPALTTQLQAVVPDGAKRTLHTTSHAMTADQKALSVALCAFDNAKIDTCSTSTDIEEHFLPEDSSTILHQDRVAKLAYQLSASIQTKILPSRRAVRQRSRYSFLRLKKTRRWQAQM